MGLAGRELHLEASWRKSLRTAPMRARQRPLKRRIVGKNDQTGAEEMNPSTKSVPQPKQHRQNLNRPKQALTPLLHKSPHLFVRQPASPVDLPLVAVVLDETNIQKTGTPTGMEIQGIWRTHRAAASPTKLVETPLALATAVSTEHTSMVGSQGGQASRATCTHSERR